MKYGRPTGTSLTERLMTDDLEAACIAMQRRLPSPSNAWAGDEPMTHL
jgi:hypothetical protein